jgi:hypothetical protein
MVSSSDGGIASAAIPTDRKADAIARTPASVIEGK